MKKLIIIFAFLPLFCNAQQLFEDQLSIGDELILAQKRRHTAIIISAISGSIAILPFILVVPEDRVNRIIITVGVLQLISIGLMINSWSHIGRAGRLMNEKKIGITFNNGIGLRYRI